jgi:hypothetical protein
MVMKNSKRFARAVGRAALVMAMFTAPLASAHEGHEHGAEESSLKGTVEALDGQKLTLKGVDGKSMNVHVDGHTRYDDGHAGGSAADLRPGVRVVIHGEKMKDGTFHAATIRYAKDAKHAEHDKH